MLETDKPGTFGLLSTQVLLEKKEVAVRTQFPYFEGNLKRLKCWALTILKDSELAGVVMGITCISKGTFSVKYLLRHHKEGMPLRLVVSENDTCPNSLP